jgi:hypothetical protein
MTEKRPDDSKKGDRSAVAEAQKPTPAERQARTDVLWETVNKALNTLMVGHAAGLVTCFTLLKDKDNPQLKELGWFITLFGFGLFLAVVSSAVWVAGRFNYWVLPFTGGKRWKISHRDWSTAALAIASTGLMALAILSAVFKFGTL